MSLQATDGDEWRGWTIQTQGACDKRAQLESSVCQQGPPRVSCSITTLHPTLLNGSCLGEAALEPLVQHRINRTV